METIVIKSGNKAYTKMIVEIARKFKMKAEVSTDTPNAETVKAMNDIKAGKVKKYDSANELFRVIEKKLNV